MKKFAILALAVLCAIPASAAGVTIGGYIDIGYISPESDFNGSTLQASGATNSSIGVAAPNKGFSLNEVNVDFSSQLTNDISAFFSVDFVNGAAAAVGIDYGYIDISNPGPFDLNIRVGRIPSVFGIEQRASESNQTKFINLSTLSPLTVGSLDALAVYGSFSPINYAVAISNSDQIGTATSLAQTYNVLLDGTTRRAGGAPRNNGGSALLNGFDNNNGFAVSGRVGVVPIEGLEVGLSYSREDSRAATTGAQSGAQHNDRSIIGADVSYSFGPWGLKAEYVRAKEEQEAGTAAAAVGREVDVRGYYVEGTYDVSSKYSVGARYGRVKSSQANVNTRHNDFSTINIAGVYRMADNVHLKAEYDINKEHVISNNSLGRVGDPTRNIENNVFALSLVGSF